MKLVGRKDRERWKKAWRDTETERERGREKERENSIPTY